MRRSYLEPLRIASADLETHLQHISNALSEDDKEEMTFLRETFLKVKDLDRNGHTADFEYWCNGEGHFATATLYRASVYFWAAERVKREVIIAVDRDLASAALMSAIEGVRNALGGKYGIWQTIQDSIGTYVKEPSGEAVPYWKFCRQLAHPHDYVWLLRLLDFFMDFEGPAQQQIIKSAIDKLRTLEKSIAR